MLAVGLTGGIGSGKSTIASLLAARGAAIVDADQIAHDVAVPGGPAYEPLVARFGPVVVAPDGALDRAALAALAFSDPVALADLNAITHPVIGALMATRLVELSAAGGGIAVVVIPLLRRAHVDALGLRGVIVVDCPSDVALRRLVERRGMDEEDARARIAAQPSREERLALADVVVENSGTQEALRRRVDELWAWLEALDRRRGGHAGAVSG
jgi:dephospho-CoA kinase